MGQWMAINNQLNGIFLFDPLPETEHENYWGWWVLSEVGTELRGSQKGGHSWSLEILKCQGFKAKGSRLGELDSVILFILLLMCDWW